MTFNLLPPPPNNEGNRGIVSEGCWQAIKEAVDDYRNLSDDSLSNEFKDIVTRSCKALLEHEDLLRQGIQLWDYESDSPNFCEIENFYLENT